MTENEAAAWVSSDLATRYAVSGEDAADYIGRFEAKFGDDPVAALSKTTGKKDARGNDMYVWQDYVAGTDPLDTNSVFTAMIKMVDGKPVVEWSPKLGAADVARRRYTIYGKAWLGAGEEWHSPTNALDRFFMVGVSTGSLWSGWRWRTEVRRTDIGRGAARRWTAVAAGAEIVVLFRYVHESCER